MALLLVYSLGHRSYSEDGKSALEFLRDQSLYVELSIRKLEGIVTVDFSSILQQRQERKVGKWKPGSYASNHALNRVPNVMLCNSLLNTVTRYAIDLLHHIRSDL
jgi:hypothetical protein